MGMAAAHAQNHARGVEVGARQVDASWGGFVIDDPFGPR